MVSKKELLRTKTLEEAVALVFHKALRGRASILGQEAMSGKVAEEYDALGKSSRRETYGRIAEDFRIRAGYESGAILEVGCGSGLLVMALREQANCARVVGVDISEDMIRLAHRNLTQNAHLQEKVLFTVGSVYDLSKVTLQNISYVVCRNALHRFQYPKRAIGEMYSTLAPEGKIYIRDLRRDADWQTILGRIGEQRWKSKTLVKDYIGAMAGMLTMEELENMLRSLNIKEFEITDGRYCHEMNRAGETKEYERKTEFICVIKKR